MAFFFPEHAREGKYAQLYAQLSAVERVILLREFIGVTYRNRFRFFKRHNFYSYYAAPFRHNIQVAAKRKEQRLRIARRVWNKKEILPAYLRLIYRHYVLGFALQLLRKYHRAGLPPPEPGCYPKAVYVLDALQWFLAHETEINQRIEVCMQEVMADGSRSLYIYCLQSLVLTLQLLEQSGPYLPGRHNIRKSSIGGRVPLGAELEFSNAGHKASFNHMFCRHKHEKTFHNFIYFHHFHLDHVTWRLGGYLDHHVRLRRYLPAPLIGGFFEYALVRMDYPRRYSMPLTRDPGFLALYVSSVVRFLPEVEPHSMHVNIEAVWPEPTEVPHLSDYKCLLLLGGDLQVDDDGRIREQRLCQHELMKLVRRRNHLSLFDNLRHSVNEYAFLRLHLERTTAERTSVFLALKGFNAVCLGGAELTEPIDELALWARRPNALRSEQLEAFVKRVRRGLELEQAYSAATLNRYMEDLGHILAQQNQRLPARS